MSENENKEEGNNPITPPEDMDSALQALLGDISSETPPSQEDPEAVPDVEPAAIPQEMPEVIPVASPEIQTNIPPDVIPAGLKPLPLDPNPDSPFHPAEEEYPEPSAVDAPTNPRHRFVANPAPRKRRRWPWILLLLLLMGAGGGGYYFKTTWMHHEAPTEILAELPPELELPPMDAAFLPPEEPHSPPPQEKAPEHHSEPAPAEPSKHVEPEAHAAKAPLHQPMPPHFDAPKPEEKVVVPPAPTVRAMDSATLSHLEGSMNNNKVHYRFDLMLFSREKGLRSKLPPFEEAIRAVAGNIFYFTVPGKAMLPELEQQVLQKAGFLFPDGRLIRVEVRNLELEPVKR